MHEAHRLPRCVAHVVQRSEACERIDENAESDVERHARRRRDDVGPARAVDEVADYVRLLGPVDRVANARHVGVLERHELPGTLEPLGHVGRRNASRPEDALDDDEPRLVAGGLERRTEGDVGPGG